MVDSDVAMLYHYETKKINQTLKRNVERFPENFCFQLTEHEVQVLRSQFATTANENLEETCLRSQIVTLKCTIVGASIKDLGKKCFGINKIEDMEIINKILVM